MLILFLSEFESDAVNVDYLHRWVGFQVFTQFGDIDIHASCCKIRVILPDFLQGAGAVDELVEVDAEEAQEFAFL